MLKVLIVEDDRNVAALVRHLLEEEGFVSSFSVDNEGAWGSLTGEPPDAAIIDLGLLASLRYLMSQEVALHVVGTSTTPGQVAIRA